MVLKVTRLQSHSIIYSRKNEHKGGYFVNVRRSSHQSGSPQNGLGDERTCGITLASAYVLCCLSVMWSQLQMKERKSK